MSSVEFEPTIPAGERLHTYALDRVTTGIGTCVITVFIYLSIYLSIYQSINLFIYLSGFITAVAVFRKTNAIPLNYIIQTC
jgi:hypothetical protein